MFAQYSFYRVVEKFPIQQIKRKKLRNEVNMNSVFYMLMNFEREAWAPITLDHDCFLVDGQHRIEFAKQTGLKYIDVVIQLCVL